MRYAILILLTIASSPAFGQPQQKVYDHTGVVSFVSGQSDFQLTTDNGITNCFGDTDVVCTDRYYVGGAFEAKLDDAKLPQGITMYTGTGGKGNGPKVNPLLPPDPKNPHLEFKYRHAYIDINYYNKHVPAFCVPAYDKNGKQKGEACYALQDPLAESKW